MSIQRFSRPILALVAVLAFVLVAATLATAAMFSSESDAPTSQPVALGAYISGAKEDPVQIDEFADMAGTSPAIVMWFQGWAGNENRFDPPRMDAVASRGAMPMVTWEPWDYAERKTQPEYSLRKIVAGKHDRYVRQWARDAAEWGEPLYLRFAHEMNADWYSWSAGVNGNTSAEYVAAWRHVVDIFRQEGATNVRWVWSPSVSLEGGTPFEELYPGDDYVDWIALDGYNYGDSQVDGGPSYDEIIALAPEKPFMISETASTEEGGDKATWMRDAFYLDIPTRLPKTKAVVWFNKDKLADWRVNSSPSSLAAYSEVAASPKYRGQLS
jgi:beta-mannanase